MPVMHVLAVRIAMVHLAVISVEAHLAGFHIPLIVTYRGSVGFWSHLLVDRDVSRVMTVVPALRQGLRQWQYGQQADGKGTGEQGCVLESDHADASLLLDADFPEHAEIHMHQHVAVVGPAAESIGGDTIAAFRARRHIDGVLAHFEIA